MQSPRMSAIESGVKMLVTGTAAALTNYFLLPIIWTLPPTQLGSVGMAAWFGLQSFGLTYIIRRIFNARET